MPLNSRSQTPHGSRGSTRVRIARWSPLTALVLLGLGAPAFVAFAPKDPHRLAAVFPPWWSAADSLSAAATVGAVTGLGGASFIVAVSGDSPDLAAALRRAGALFVVDGRRFAFCGALNKG